MTSRDVVDLIQTIVAPGKAGHAGTLDPLATGVLVVCVGSATRLIEYVQRLPKTYHATFLLGRSSDTDDIEGTVVPLPQPREPTRDEIEAALPRFVGEISQRPPAYSAIKVGGRRAYDRARRGESVDLPARPVTVHSFRLLRYEYPELEVEIACGSGTYVRSLGRDLAESLGTAAVMSGLTRTAIGPFTIDRAVDPRTLHAVSLAEALQPPLAAVTALPQLPVTAEETTRIVNGQFLPKPQHGFTGEVAAVTEEGQLLAVLLPIDADSLRPDKVLAVR